MAHNLEILTETNHIDMQLGKTKLSSAFYNARSSASIPPVSFNNVQPATHVHAPNAYDPLDMLNSRKPDPIKLPTTDDKQFLFGYDLPSQQAQIHFHGSDDNNLSHSHLLNYQREKLKEFNAYESSMLDLGAQNLNLKRFP